MIKVIISALCIYLVLLVALALFQRTFIYFPHTLEATYTFPPYVPELEEVFIACEDGATIHGIYAPAGRSTPVILIFHGNAGNITHRYFLVQGFHQLNYPVFLIDYHGYGKSEGTPSEVNLYLDGRAALKWLKEEKGVAPNQIVLLGKSLGSGVAVELATKKSFKGVILETPVSSIASVARSHFPYNCFPVNFLLRDKYDNLSKIASVRSPVIFIHGTRDSIVGKRESEKLFEKANNPKELYLVEGADHNDVQDVEPQKYWERVSRWIEGLP
jgi:fermentation-respiration switch protein FrsA (DUF1100 family)